MSHQIGHWLYPIILGMEQNGILGKENGTLTNGMECHEMEWDGMLCNRMCIHIQPFQIFSNFP